jgi:hypothetical protein
MRCYSCPAFGLLWFEFVREFDRKNMKLLVRNRPDGEAPEVPERGETMPAVAFPTTPMARTPVVFPPSAEKALNGVRAKQQIITQLIEGELGLMEAAARFFQVSRESRPGKSVPAPQDGEDVCRTVIGWAYLALADRPEQADILGERLEAELKQARRRAGRIALPEPR